MGDTGFTNMTILFFSATGNSLWAAKYIGGELKSIPQLERAGEYEIADDVIGIISPVYNLTLPLLVSRYLTKAKLKAGYIFGVLTYGFMSGVAAGKLVKALKANGNAIHYTACLKMVDNYLPGFRMESQTAGLPGKQVDANAASIKRDIENRLHRIPRINPIWRMISPIWNRKMELGKGMRAINNNDRKFSVTGQCIGCGTCARVCPVSNITVKGRPEFHHRCESCFACIHNCPKRAIQLKDQRSEARFRNANVALKELIEANGR